MTQFKFGSPGVNVKETIPKPPSITHNPTSIACVIGTSKQGPAFVPTNVGSLSEFYSKFGHIDHNHFGPIAASEWLKNSSSIYYLRVLGIGDGQRYIQERILSGGYVLNGGVTNAGFIVGDAQPGIDGNVTSNSYTSKFSLDNNHNVYDSIGRVWFLGSYVSESNGASWLSDAGLEKPAYLNQVTPIVRAIVFSASGTYLQLSASVIGGVSNIPTVHPTIPNCLLKAGNYFGDVRFSNSKNESKSKQEFVMFINGHKSNDVITTITASFDMNAPNYFANVFNRDPYKLQEAGHYLYAHWDVPTTWYHVTGTNLVNPALGIGSPTNINNLCELDAFLTPGTLLHTGNLGNQYSPNYENWRDRFRHAKTPWITSQSDGDTPENLFRLHALSHGEGVSTGYKFSIENIVPGSQFSYGSFDVLVRDWDDTDESPVVLERFSAVNLDCTSDRYIAKVIGDLHVYYDFEQSSEFQQLTYTGTYPNVSNVIRIEVANKVADGTLQSRLVPFGVRGYPHLNLSGSSPMSMHNDQPTNLTQYASTSYLPMLHLHPPPVPMRSNMSVGSDDKKTLNKNLYWGVQFEHSVMYRANDCKIKNESLKSFAKYYPDFQKLGAPFIVGDNEGQLASSENGILDSDRFHHNSFSLEKIQVTTGSSGIADPTQWINAAYVRDGNIIANDSTKTRSLVASDLTDENRQYAKFTFFMQGGFDGVNIFDKNAAYINDAASVYDSLWPNRNNRGGMKINDIVIIDEQQPFESTKTTQAASVRPYLTALDIISDDLASAMGVLALPGIRNRLITDVATDSAETLDSLYLMDIEQYDDSDKVVLSSDQRPSTRNTINSFVVRNVDTSFAAAYFPDVLYNDKETNQVIVVPPTVAAIAALSLNDKLGHPWTAPAGSKRGVVQSVSSTSNDLTKDQIDNAYNASINPISLDRKLNKVVILGQKTLAKTSTLDRINVRRLLIDLRKQIKEVGQQTMFERDKDATVTKFVKSLLPRLQKLQSSGGISKYKIILDPKSFDAYDIVDGVIRGKVFIQPTETIEFVSVDFAIRNIAV